MARRPLAQAIGFELSCFALPPINLGEGATGSTVIGTGLRRMYLRPRPLRTWPSGLDGFRRSLRLVGFALPPRLCTPSCLCRRPPRDLPGRRYPLEHRARKVRQVRPSRSPNRVVGACISSTINRVIQVLYSPNERLLIYGAVRSLTFY